MSTTINSKFSLQYNNFYFWCATSSGWVYTNFSWLSQLSSSCPCEMRTVPSTALELYSSSVCDATHTSQCQIALSDDFHIDVFFLWKRATAKYPRHSLTALTQTKLHGLIFKINFFAECYTAYQIKWGNWLWLSKREY